MIFSLSVRLEGFQLWALFNPWYCVTRVPLQIFLFLSNRSCIWLQVKPDVLLTTSIMRKAKYLRGISYHKIYQEIVLQSCKNEHCSWYDFYSYVILVSMNLWNQHLASHIFCIMPYIQNLVWSKCQPSIFNTFFQEHWKSHMIELFRNNFL